MTSFPTFVINVKHRKDRLKNIQNEFHGRNEFNLNIIEASEDVIGRVGLWKSIRRIVEHAQKESFELVIISEDDHIFTQHYQKELFIQQVHEARVRKADVLSGGIAGFGYALPVVPGIFWIDWFWATQFIVIYQSFYEQILGYSFKDTDTADGVISNLSMSKMTLYPFISKQKDFGYSDVTVDNNKGSVFRLFKQADGRFLEIKQILDQFKS